MDIQKEYRTRCGGKLIPYDNAAQYFAAHPEVVKLLPEAVGMIDLPADGTMLEVQLDFGRVLGPATMVQTITVAPNEIALFADRPARRGLSRVAVLSRAQIPMITTFVVVGKPMGEQTYRLVTAYRGVRAPGEPWSLQPGEARDKSLEFWCRHALVWDKTMGEPFHFTWEDAIESARQRSGS